MKKNTLKISADGTVKKWEKNFPVSDGSPRRRVQVSFDGHPSLTAQQFKDDCDINLIMQRHAAGEPIDAHIRQGKFVDLTTVPSYQEAMNLIVEADQAFASLPATVRARFDNTPSKFLQFAQDPANMAEMIRMGLAIERTPPPKAATLDDVVDALKSAPRAPNKKPDPATE